MTWKDYEESKSVYLQFFLYNNWIGCIEKVYNLTYIYRVLSTINILDNTVLPN